MTCRRRALVHISCITCCVRASYAFTGTLRPNISNGLRIHPLFQPSPPGDAPRGRYIRQFARAGLNANPANDDDSLDQTLDSENLERILSYLQSHPPSMIASLTQSQLESIFRAIEVATVESDENTVNKRAIEDARTIDFRSMDRARAQMTKLYRLLQEGGRLDVFGAVGRPPPPSSSSVAASPPPPPQWLPVYPTSGSKLISPTLLEKITGMEMISLPPRPTNLLLYGGAALAVIEGIASLYFGINFNLLVACTILLAVMDQVLVSGAVFETALRMAKPEMSGRITRHEAGHFLCAYLLGCPVEGVVLSTWAALNRIRGDVVLRPRPQRADIGSETAD